jgi:hypothetical protein
MKYANAYKKTIWRRPVSNEGLANSIKYIRLRDAYLQREGVLVRTGDRSWRLNSK